MTSYLTQLTSLCYVPEYADFTIIEGVRGKKPQVTLDLMLNFPFFISGSEKQFARRILQSIRCHIGSFSMHAFNYKSLFVS